MSQSRQALHDGWRLSAATGPVPAHIRGEVVPAQVPGSAHLDLLAAGLIPDPYLDRAEEELAWTHRAGWRYALTFDAVAPAAGERVDLVFDGLDTVAVVELNGRQLGFTANMHRSYRFDARSALRTGANEIVVSFRSALEYAEEIAGEIGRPHNYPHPFNTVRKMACSFGWDWGPDLQTAGIWKPVRLERWTTARLAAVRPLVTVTDEGTGRVELHADIERAGDDAAVDLVLAVQVAGREAHVAVPAGETSAVVTLDVPDVARWWPVGYGDQPLYDLSADLRDSDGALVDSAARRIGFRTITVDVTPDEIGTPFTVVVNGLPVFVKGVNWIPDDHFLTRITRERLAHRIDQALGAHVNLL
ncbi:glycosyl hydrolase 2 galactose-binding domain-containing protein, partial [Streptomyces sp. NPDC004752]